ncbi:META domain-containing protein [Halosquirtibacter xylanolyticus]|uniref:META domain-containing protein n=1 Tax=Halosquirtibacter xylanolyticus TaxID=3374599 RepID=UPI00374A6B2F|nr:META domain-containing protein [Prolixibacteraceae bacterium]
MKYFNHLSLLTALLCLMMSSCTTTKFATKKTVNILPYYHEVDQGEKQLILQDVHGQQLFVNAQKLVGAEMQMGYTQSVKLEKNKDQGLYKVTQSLGTVIDTSSSRINDMWVLKKLHNKAIQSNAPTLTVDLRKQRAYGTTGCNRYHSNFHLLEGGKISFGMIASTKMLCPNSDVEMEFTSLLQKVNGYQIKDRHLYLTVDGNEVMNFLKID